MLYIVATPIGNLKDITIRALEVLKESDCIFCEDTRRTLNLLNHYNIKKPLFRYSDHILQTAEKIIKLVEEGKKVCLVSDGGIPNISDPGIVVIKKAIERNIKIEVIGGVSAVTNAVSLSGYDGSGFVFLGFLERSRKRILKTLTEAFLLNLPVVIYESPNRIVDFLEIIKEEFPDTNVVIAREMTKIYEEWIRGNVDDVLSNLKKRENIKGEITVILKIDIKNKKEEIKSIGFVCTANTCRSPMAEYYTKKIVQEKNLKINISSRGIYALEEEMCSEAKEVLKRNGIVVDNHISKQLDRNFMENNDLILVMTKKHKEIITAFFPEYKNKVFTLLEYAGYGSGDIYDPYGKSYYEYELAFRNIKKSIDKIIELIQKKS